MAGASQPWKDAVLRSALWLLLGGWVGAWALFATVVAPAAFRLLPAPDAGSLVGPVLASLRLYGGFAGVALAILGRALGRSAWLSLLPLLMSGLCLYSHFGVTAEMAEVGGPETANGLGNLHRISVGIYAAVGLCALALLGLHARADARHAVARSESPAPARARL